MASSPAFANVPRVLTGAVSTANTNRDGTGTIVTLTQQTVGATAPTAGMRIDRMVVKATGDPADSVVTLFLHDGTAYWLFDEFDLGDPVASSTTVAGYRMERVYTDLVLPSGWSIRAAITVALTGGVVNVFAFGADLT